MPTAQSQTEVRSGLYHRAFSWVLAHLDPTDKRLYGERKAQLMGELHGRILDVGAGAGANLAYLDAGTEYVALEPNLHLHEHIEEAAAERGIRPTIITGTAERLPFDEASFDCVITTLVLCSVDDMARSLAEIRRVLRPEGTFVFLEHVAAPDGTLLRRLQRLLRWPWRRIADGCHPDREAGRAIAEADFDGLEMEGFDVPAGLLRPHIAGWAKG